VKKLLFIAAVVIIASISILPRVNFSVFAEGATLTFSPESGSFDVGKNFTIKVYVSSGGQAINAAEGVVNFDNKLLSVTKVSKDSSIFTLWAVEPGFSNANGTVTFGGGNTSPFTGSNGTAVAITFKALKTGTFELAFASGSVLAADGKGTNVLSSFGKGSYTIKEPEAPRETPRPTPIPLATPAPTPTPSIPPLAPPEISSVTHPDPEQWYNNNNPEYTWTLPPDVVGVSTALNTEPDADPGAVLPELIESHTFKDVPDGAWFVHFKFQDKNGAVAVVHRKLLIDRTPPRPFLIRVEMDDPTDPRPRLFFNASDETSGLKHYEIQIGDGENVTMTIDDFKRQMMLVKKIAEEDLKPPYPYIMPVQAAGAHSVHVKALDRAGNGTI